LVKLGKIRVKMAVGPPKRKSKEGNVMKEMQKNSTRKKDTHFYSEVLVNNFGKKVLTFISRHLRLFLATM